MDINMRMIKKYPKALTHERVMAIFSRHGLNKAELNGIVDKYMRGRDVAPAWKRENVKLMFDNATFRKWSRYIKHRNHPMSDDLQAFSSNISKNLLLSAVHELVDDFGQKE